MNLKPLFDLVNNAPVAELLAPDEELKTTYDLICPSEYTIQKMIRLDMLDEFDYDLITEKLSKIAGQSLIINNAIPNEKVIDFSKQNPPWSHHKYPDYFPSKCHLVSRM